MSFVFLFSNVVAPSEDLVFWSRQVSAGFVCFIVAWVVAAAVDVVRDRISKKNVSDKIVVSEDGDERDVMEEVHLQRVLQSLDDAREKVIKALQKSKIKT